MIESRFPALQQDGLVHESQGFTSGIGFAALSQIVKPLHVSGRSLTKATVVHTTGELGSSPAPDPNDQTSTVPRTPSQQYCDQHRHGQKEKDTASTDVDIPPSPRGKIPYPTYSLRLVFGTAGRQKRSISMDQVRLDHSMKDQDAILRIMKAYRTLRGFFKYWFSIFKLETFVFTKFVKHARRRVYRQHDGPEIPESDPDYEYTPGRMQPPCHERPPIHRSEFMCLLDICPRSCMLGALGWHECNEPLYHSQVIARLPKKKTIWELNNDERSFAWGLECSFEISAFRVLLWHTIIALVCFEGWIWLTTIGLPVTQSTSVPLALTMIAISAFWSSAGILQPYGDNQKDTSRAYGSVQAYGSYIHQGDIITTTISSDSTSSTPVHNQQLLSNLPFATTTDAGYLAEQSRECRGIQA